MLTSRNNDLRWILATIVESGNRRFWGWLELCFVTFFGFYFSCVRGTKTFFRFRAGKFSSAAPILRWYHQCLLIGYQRKQFKMRWMASGSARTSSHPKSTHLKSLSQLFTIPINPTSLVLQQFHHLLLQIAPITCVSSTPPHERIPHFLYSVSTKSACSRIKLHCNN